MSVQVGKYQKRYISELPKDINDNQQKLIYLNESLYFNVNWYYHRKTDQFFLKLLESADPFLLEKILSPVAVLYGLMLNQIVVNILILESNSYLNTNLIRFQRKFPKFEVVKIVHAPSIVHHSLLETLDPVRHSLIINAVVKGILSQYLKWRNNNHYEDEIELICFYKDLLRQQKQSTSLYQIHQHFGLMNSIVYHSEIEILIEHFDDLKAIEKQYHNKIKCIEEIIYKIKHSENIENIQNKENDSDGPRTNLNQIADAFNFSCSLFYSNKDWMALKKDIDPQIGFKPVSVYTLFYLINRARRRMRQTEFSLADIQRKLGCQEYIRLYVQQRNPPSKVTKKCN